ncbi:MAG: hypothetical protein Q7U04_03895 [Bacteriovorax sp.]|nr:hypothetical protein [Bacteriovorax sp.]
MKSFLSLILISITLSSCSSPANKNRYPSSENENAEMKEFHNFDSDAESIFSKLSNKKWSQKFDTVAVRLLYDIDANGKLTPIEDSRFPFGFEKKLDFSLSKQTKKTLLGKRDYYFFGMLGGTWAGIDTQYPSHGGGYATQIPVKKLGVNKDGQTYRFLFWAREDYYVDEEAKRMHTDLLHPALLEAKDTLQLEKILKDEPACKDILKNSFMSYIDCVINRVAFDYLILEYSPESPDSLEVIGKDLNSNNEVFRIKMKSK